MSLKPIFKAGLLACLPLFMTPVMAATPSPTPAGLEDLMNQVWESHPGVQAAQSAVEAARARGDAASQPIYNPELELDAERTAVNTLSIGVNQTIDWGDKRGAQRQMGAAGVQIAQAELNALRQEIATEVLSALARYRNAEVLQQLAQRHNALIEQLVTTTEQRYAAGDLGQLDVAMAKVALGEARMRLARRSSEVVTQQAALVAASGLHLEQWPQLPAQPDAAPAEPPRAALLAQLPAIVAQQSRISNTRSAVDLARAARRADPTLGVRGGADDSDLLLGLSLSMPLYVRNTYTAEVTAASQQTVQEEMILQDMHRRAGSRFDGSLSAYRVTQQAWRQWLAQGQGELANQLNLVQQIWEAGEMSTTDYLLQTGQNIGSQITAAELNGDLWQAWIEWLSASGQIESWLAGSGRQ